MRILIIGGMHGNEPLGIKLVKKFIDNPVENVNAVFANEKAMELNCRFANQDLNRSFPGNRNSNNYEIKRAAYLINLCKKYDIVFDFHNTHCPNNNCAFVGESARDSLYNVSSWLGIKKIIIADYDCINKYVSNCASIEISLNSKLMNPDIWYRKICQFSQMGRILKAKAIIEKYRFVYRITLEDRDRLKLPEKNLKAFRKISKKLAWEMGIKDPAYPIFIADEYTPYNYGGLLHKI